MTDNTEQPLTWGVNSFDEVYPGEDTDHQVHAIRRAFQNPGGWVIECWCHNPDGEGEGRADFQAATIVEAVEAFMEHADERSERSY